MSILSVSRIELESNANQSQIAIYGKICLAHDETGRFQQDNITKNFFGDIRLAYSNGQINKLTLYIRTYVI